MTETQTVDLAAWLTRIWDEEERLARGAATEGTGIFRPSWTPREYDYAGIVAHGETNATDARETAETRHIAAHDPASVLARIAADRKILELHTAAHECPELRTGTYPADWPESASWGQPGGTWKHTAVERYEDGEYCPTLRLLASPYKGREGWQEEWE